MKPGIARQFAISTLLWSIPATLSAIPSIREGKTLGQIAAPELLPWLVWAALTPLIFVQARRHPLEKPHRSRDVRAHLATALVIGVCYATINVALYLAFGDPVQGSTFARSMMEALFVWIPLSVVFYAILTSVGLVLAYQSRLQERDLHAARLESQLSDARLHALRNQLNPHFLFNTLNTIAMHVRSGDSQQSVKMIARLSELLRHMLDEERAQKVPLHTELDYLERYLEIEGVRFGDRLRASIEVPDELRDALVPNLLLQPLVENAIRHGIAKRADAGHLMLRAERRNGSLIVEVLNDGVALPTDFSIDNANGIGLRNTVSRLSHLYGNTASLRIENRPGEMVAATVELPWQT